MSDPTITDVETYLVANPWKPWVFVRLKTDAGIDGIAEATAHGKPHTIAAAIEELSRYVIGERPFDTERRWLEIYRNEWYSRNVVNMTAISAFDTACWDIKGKLLDRPLYDLLGGAVYGTSLRAYANGWYTDAGGEPAGFAGAAERVVREGYDALKFDPFGAAWKRLRRCEFNRAIEIVQAVREAVGPDIDLLIEGHGRFRPGRAVEVADALAQFDPTWFEEPCPPDNVDGLRKVAANSRLPIATGERGVSKHAFRELLADTDVDVIQPDLANAGGVTEGKKIAAMAEAEHVGFAPHNPQGPVATAVSAHVDTSTPSFAIQEVFEDYDVDWKADLLEEPIAIENGWLQVPEGPGLGIDLNLDAVRDHAYTGEDADHINLFETGWETRSMDGGDR